MGCLQPLLQGLPLSWLYTRLGVRHINVGELDPDFDMPSPWIALVRPTRLLVNESLERSFHLWHDDGELTFFKMSMYQEVANRAFPMFIALDWATSRDYKHLRYFSRFLIDKRLERYVNPSKVKVSIFPAIFESFAVKAWRLVMRSIGRTINRLRKSTTNLGSHNALPSENNRGSRSSPKVLAIANNSLRYYNLFRFDEFLSTDPSSRLHPQNIGFLASESRELENGQTAVGFSSLITQSGLVSQAISALGVARLLQLRLQDGPILLRRITLRARAAEYARNLRSRYPLATSALLLYDIRVPIELLYALRKLNIRTISNHERPQAGLVPYLPLIVDSLLVESDYFKEQLIASEYASVGQYFPVGMWRSDWIIDGKSLPKTTERPYILILPFVLKDQTEDIALPSDLTLAGIRDFLAELIQLAEMFSELDFVIRTKQARWANDERVSDLVLKISSLANIRIDTNYEEPYEAYRLSSHARMILAKYTSMVEEAIYAGVPAIVHDYSHNRHSANCQEVIHLPKSMFVHSFEELVDRLLRLVTDEEGALAIRPQDTQMQVFGGPADGRTLTRITQVLEERVSTDVS